MNLLSQVSWVGMLLDVVGEHHPQKWVTDVNVGGMKSLKMWDTMVMKDMLSMAKG